MWYTLEHPARQLGMEKRRRLWTAAMTITLDDIARLGWERTIV